MFCLTEVSLQLSVLLKHCVCSIFQYFIRFLSNIVSRMIYTISGVGVGFQIYFTTLQKYKIRETIYIKILRNNKTPLFPFHLKQEMWSSVFQNHLIASILWKCFWALWDIDLWDSKRSRFVNQLFSDDTFYLNFLPFCKNVV